VRRGPPWLWPLAGLVAVAAIGGGAAAALLGGGHDTGAAASSQPSVSVRTVTQPGTTIVTTAPAPAGDPHALNDRAWALMKQGDYASALPLLQQAVQELQGQTGDIYTAYANYNLGVTLMSLGRCSEAMPYLEASREQQPGRHEVEQAIHQARKCSKG